MVDGMAGKGDKYRPVDRKRFDENFSKIFGEKKKSKGSSQWCVHGKKIFKDGVAFEKCEVCQETKRGTIFIDCYSTPRWNRGLGCYVYSSRDTEQKARKLGLQPIGNEKMEKITERYEKETRPDFKGMLAESYKELRQRRMR